MRKFLYIVLITSILNICCECSFCQTPLSNRVANYDMNIDLDVENKTLIGNTKLTWKNTSSDTIKELYFHMYYNAFKNLNSTFMRNRGVSSFLNYDIDEECGWGWTNISSFVDENKNELINKAQYVSPDDGNENDESVLKIELTDHIFPGESHIFNFKWKAKVPKTMPRTGYNKEFFFFAQWFPKVGVYEPAGMRLRKKGGWNCHQYHSSGEYYSDFGNYDVKMTVPENYVVASSGQLFGQEKKNDKKTWRFKVDDVIDFTWSCSPHFIINKDQYKDTEIKFYTYPYKEHLKERYFPTIKFCMEYLEKHLGVYPYPTLTILDPPIHGMFTGGMEYPTLITSLSFGFFPKGIKTPETLVVHEYIHQYFMQMVANHEVEETWLDEGITTYYEGRILDAYMGENRSTIDLNFFKCGNKAFNRAEFFGSDSKQLGPNSIKSWQYKHGGYGDIAYNKTALWLQTMEGIIGIDVMDDIMKTYFQQWKFKHPHRQNFIDIANEISQKQLPEKFPEGLDWFFDQVIYGTELCDYKIKSIKNKENYNKRGFFQDVENCENTELQQSKYTSQVIIQRDEGIMLPLEVALVFEDGNKKLYQLDGIKRSEDITIQSDSKIISAYIDPNRKLMIDKNWINNSMTIKPQKRGIKKLLLHVLDKVQQIMDTCSYLI